MIGVLGGLGGHQSSGRAVAEVGEAWRPIVSEKEIKKKIGKV